MNARFFKTPEDFRAWLQKHHRTEGELVVGFYKKGLGKPSISYSEAVEQALCFGWIDGVAKRIDDTSYSIRFSPRRAGSNWRAVNIRRPKELSKLGLMRAAGLKAARPPIGRPPSGGWSVRSRKRHVSGAWPG